MLEFIDMEHTPKNILIRAVRKKEITAEQRQEEKNKIANVMKFLQIKPMLWKLLESENEQVFG